MTEVEIKYKIAVAIASRQMTKDGVNESTEIIYKLLNELLIIQRVSQRSELLLDFMEHLSNYHNIDEVIDCTKYQHIIEQYEKSNNCG